MEVHSSARLVLLGDPGQLDVHVECAQRRHRRGERVRLGKVAGAGVPTGRIMDTSACLVVRPYILSLEVREAFFMKCFRPSSNASP